MQAWCPISNSFMHVEESLIWYNRLSPHSPTYLLAPLPLASHLIIVQVQANADLAQIKSSYKKLAMALHPDKCKVDGAAAAFQRANLAYSRLTKRFEEGDGAAAAAAP